MKPTLEEHIQCDPRILRVYLEARPRYAEVDLLHHNFTHVMPDLYRALVIAADQGSVKYEILIPSVLIIRLPRTISGKTGCLKFSFYY